MRHLRPAGPWSAALALLWLGLAGAWLGARAADPDPREALRQAAERAYANRFFAEAETAYGKLLAQAEKEDPDELVRAGVGLLESQFAQMNFAAAEATLAGIPGRYANLRKRRPELPADLEEHHRLLLNYWRARLLLVADQPREAVAAFQAAQRSPDPSLRAKAQLYLGYAYLARQEWDQADTEFRALVGRGAPAEDENAARIGILELLLRQEKDTLVEERFNAWWQPVAGLPGDPWRQDLAMFRVLWLTERDRLAEALAAYDREFKDDGLHLRLWPNYVVVRGLAQRLAAAHEYRQAHDLCAAVHPQLSLDRQRQEFTLLMGEAALAAGKELLDRQDLAEATKWFTRAEADFARFLGSYRNADLTPKVGYRRGQLRRFTAAVLAAEANRDPAKSDKAKLDAAAELWAQAARDFTEVTAHPQAAVELCYDAMLQLSDYHRFSTGNFDSALDWVARAAGLAVPREQQALALMLRANILAENKNQFDEAAHQYQLVANQYADTSQGLEARFRQADADFQGGAFKDAAVVFGQFADEAGPKHARRPQALYLKGVSHRLAGQTGDAIRTLLEMADAYAASPDDWGPKALLQAAEAALAGDLDTDAVTFLTKVVEQYPDSPQRPLALYRRGYCALQVRRDLEAALRDVELFFAKKGNYAETNPDLAADLLLGLGDYYLDRQEYQPAEEYFVRLVRQFKTTAGAPQALYEAAKCAYYRENLGAALDYLKRLEDEYGERAGDRVRAHADYLYGDILSLQGQYEPAAARFTACASRVATSLHFAALGRLGDMKFALAGKAETRDEADKLYREALAKFDDILKDKSGPADQFYRRKALFRRASVKMMLKDDTAVADYREILASYDESILRQEHWDWFYFVRAGIELAKYYEANGKIEDAIKIYELLGRANISYADEARQRARKLRQTK